MEEISAHGGALRKQAQALLQAGRFDEAEQVCREEIAFYEPFGTAALAHEGLGDILLAKGEYQKALDEYVVFSRNGDSNTLYLNIALCYVRLGDLEKARKAVQSYPEKQIAQLAADPPVEGARSTGDLKSMELVLMLALAGVHSGDSPEALKYLLAAEKLAPDDWEIADTIGQRLDYMARYDDAIPYYKRAIRLGGDKVSYRHRTRVEMFDLQKKQQDAKRAPVEPSAPR